MMKYMILTAGCVGVRGSVRGMFFTRHQHLDVLQTYDTFVLISVSLVLRRKIVDYSNGLPLGQQILH